jgi:threonine synthase
LIPVGNAGNITAYWAGFSEYAAAGLASRRPRMQGFQAAGAAPIVLDQIVENPETIASAIRIGNPASWRAAVAARDESGGGIDSVTDDEIIEAYGRLAREEGIFCEPASAASVAGLVKLAGQQSLEGKQCVCVITGAGLKDPGTASRFEANRIDVPAELGAIERVLTY